MADLTVFDNGALTKKKKALIQLKEDMPYVIETTILLAQITRTKYDALIKEGFTKEEALELSKVVS